MWARLRAGDGPTSGVVNRYRARNAFVMLTAVVANGRRFEFGKDVSHEKLEGDATKTGPEYEGSHAL
jgi:hypothetical protein